MSAATPYVRLTCTNRGAHEEVPLARVTCTVGDDEYGVVALRGAALAAFNAGSGRYAGRPITVDVSTNPVPPTEEEGHKWNAIVPADRLEVSRRKDGQRVWLIRCNRCKRAPRIAEADMRRIPQTDRNVFDLSFGPW